MKKFLVLFVAVLLSSLSLLSGCSDSIFDEYKKGDLFIAEKVTEDYYFARENPADRYAELIFSKIENIKAVYRLNTDKKMMEITQSTGNGQRTISGYYVSSNSEFLTLIEAPTLYAVWIKTDNPEAEHKGYEYKYEYEVHIVYNDSDSIDDYIKNNSVKYNRSTILSFKGDR